MDGYKKNRINVISWQHNKRFSRLRINGDPVFSCPTTARLWGPKPHGLREKWRSKCVMTQDHVYIYILYNIIIYIWGVTIYIYMWYNIENSGELENYKMGSVMNILRNTEVIPSLFWTSLSGCFSPSGRPAMAIACEQSSLGLKIHIWINTMYDRNNIYIYTYIYIYIFNYLTMSKYKII